MATTKTTILTEDAKKGHIDLYIGNIPVWYAYEDIVNVIYTTNYYYEREARDIQAIKRLEVNDIIRIGHLKASNPKFHELIDEGQTGNKNKIDSESTAAVESTFMSESETCSTIASTIFGPKQRAQRKNKNKANSKSKTTKKTSNDDDNDNDSIFDDDDQIKTLFCFVKCKNMQIANTIRYCLNGLRIDDHHKLMSGVSNRHNTEQANVDEDAFNVDQNFEAFSEINWSILENYVKIM